MLNLLFQRKALKFLVAGSLAAMLNLLLMFLLVEKWGFDTFGLLNLANFLAIEISLIFSFFLYRFWVWPGGNWRLSKILFYQLPLYHVAVSISILMRTFIVFPLLEGLGVSYGVNTLLGILLSATLNYILSDRFVFQDNSLQFLYPEALSPALTTSRTLGTPETLLSQPTPISLFSLVIPAYNEEGCIESTIEAITNRLDSARINYEVLVINDNSKDSTEAILKNITAHNSKVRYLNNYYPNGFGFAVRCGLENFSGDAVAVVMGDCSDSPDNIVDYYQKLCEGYECVFGSRFISGAKIIDYPQHKLFINRLANQFVAVLFNLKYNDTTNAFKAYRKEVITGISPLLSHHFNLTVEMPLKAVIRGYSYTTIPISWQNRKTGISKLKIKEMGSRYLFIVLYIFLEKMLSRGDYLRPELQKSHKTASQGQKQ
ncbi:MAG: glycosyltransferase [Jaaginema sp. PMC 1079.18]|nr:glycosyltransferase [Jaaginema sp. PMC 1080.18]MEC4850181.1 glycosyltransferase [Jaaginema sp. PMC 1079.18]MEC4866774.1 glycosyltransferase [Jaaginema sp. PMC 1078.18]